MLLFCLFIMLTAAVHHRAETMIRRDISLILFHLVSAAPCGFLLYYIHAGT